MIWSVLQAVLLDVGGTLWPDVWPEHPTDDLERVARLRDATSSLSESDAFALVRALVTPHRATERQETTSLIASTLRRLNLRTDVPVLAVASAMCLPARGRVTLFPGAGDILCRLAERGPRVVIASNVVWRDAASLRRDFQELDLDDCVSAYVTSLDVGWRKPHRAFFDAALAAANVEARDCVMVGDHEANDVEPAHARGMMTVRVAIEQPPPEATVADHVCESLAEVTRLLA
jgi:FMN phosphatase YigB (HAD superfamily)